MKKTMTLILVLMFALGCLSSCENTPNEVSQDVSAESLVSDVENNSANDESSDVEAQSSFSDYLADEQRMNRLKSSLEKMLTTVNDEAFKDVKQLNVVSGIKNHHSFEEAMEFLDSFREITKDYNWYKKVPLTTEGEENGQGNEAYFENHSIICYDLGFDDEDSCAQVHMLDLDDSRLTFLWEYRELAPRISVLCGKDFESTPAEEDLIAATKMFFETYLPEYLPENSNVKVNMRSYGATATITAEPIALDPENEELVFARELATLKFSWDEYELSLADNGEKAILHEITLRYPIKNETEIETKTVISADEAWCNATGGEYFEPANDISFDLGEIFVHAYYISYRNYNETYQPCYTFICSAKEGNELFRVITKAY